VTPSQFCITPPIESPLQPTQASPFQTTLNSLYTVSHARRYTISPASDPGAVANNIPDSTKAQVCEDLKSLLALGVRSRSSQVPAVPSPSKKVLHYPKIQSTRMYQVVERLSHSSACLPQMQTPFDLQKGQPRCFLVLKHLLHGCTMFSPICRSTVTSGSSQVVSSFGNFPITRAIYSFFTKPAVNSSVSSRAQF